MALSITLDIPEELEDFLAAHNAWPGLTAEDLQQELKTMSQFQTK